MKEVMCAVFEDFVQYNGRSALLLFFGAALLFLWLVEKDRKIKTVLVYFVTALCVVFVCPFYAMIAMKIDTEVYYRVLWTLPIGILFCYSVIKILTKMKKTVSKILVCVLAVLAICINGDFVYTKSLHFKSVNAYHMPNVVIHVADALDMEYYTPKVALPAELLPFIRQYSGEFLTPYGRNMLETQWNFSHELYDAMEAEVYDTALIAQEARAEYCTYVLLSSIKEQKGTMEEQGYVQIDLIDGYYLYLDKQIFEELITYHVLSDAEIERFRTFIQ